MPTAIPFTALGKGNGFPFTCKNSTDAVINAFNGHLDYVKAFVPGAADQTDGRVYRVREVSLTEAMKYIWNLYQVTFADFTESSSGDTASFYSSDPGDPTLSYGIFKYSGDGENYINSAAAGQPRERVCNNNLDLPLPRNTFFPFDNGDGGEYFAHASEIEDPTRSAQFDIKSIYYATDTKKYYMIYQLGFVSDDGVTFIEEMPFNNLTFNYYTYN